MEYFITVFTPEKTYELGFKSDDRRLMSFIIELLKAFDCIDDITDEAITIRNCVKITTNIHKTTRHFLTTYASKFVKFHALINAIERTKKDEHIAIFVTETALTAKARVQIAHELNLINSKDNDRKHDGDQFYIYDSYDVNVAAGDRTQNFGINEGNIRRCRYCNETKPNVTFRTKAHLIPEGLGNKGLVSRDECDSCNTYFGQTIDTDIIKYFSFFRPMYNIKGRNGTPKLSGRNFTLCSENNCVAIKVKESRPHSSDDNLFRFQLDYGGKITLQNIYRSLCKYAIGMLDVYSLSDFKDTIEWIRYDKKNSLLPKVATIVDYAHFSKFPQIATYKRNIADESLPLYIGEFHFACFAFVYIIPTLNNSGLNFCNDKQYEKFWNHFTHFSKNKGWTFFDLSLDIPKDFRLDLNFTQK